jgi:DNA transposition AAA+ family ATPase
VKKELVKTKNYELFRTGITAVEQRGAAEASLMLVVGEPGFSKSIVVEQWAVQVKAVYLRAKVEWTPSRFQHELAEALAVDTSGRAKEVFGRIISAIGRNQTPIVIDEVQHTLANRARVLEAVRDISDLTETIIVLVAGEERVLPRIARFPQISSRIAKVVEFAPAPIEDVARCCAELASVQIADDLVREVHRQANGRMRDVINAIARVEQVAKRNGQKKVSLADFQGKALVEDWQARRPTAGRGGKGS